MSDTTKLETVLREWSEDDATAWCMTYKETERLAAHLTRAGFFHVADIRDAVDGGLEDCHSAEMWRDNIMQRLDEIRALTEERPDASSM